MFKKILRTLFASILVAVIGLFIWGYAPDRDAAELRAEYGKQPSQFIELPNGQTLHVRDEGPRDAPVLLLLHGSNASLHTWDQWAERLSQRYRVIRYDQAGHGLTGPHPKDDYTANAYADTAAFLMGRLGIDSYAIGGSSMGGWVAWNHALKFPGKVTGLLLVDAAGVRHAQPKKLPIGFRLAANPVGRQIMSVFTPRSIVKQSLHQTLSDPALVDDKMIDRYWDLLRFPGNRDATSKRATTTRTAATPDNMAKLKMPTLIIWGEEDKLTPFAAGQWFDKTIANSKLVSYPKIGHIPQEEVPQKSATEVEKWLNSAVIGG